MGHALIGTGECLPCVGIVAREEKIIEEDSALQPLSDNRKKRPAYEAKGGRAKAAALQLGSIADVGSKRTNHSSRGKRYCLSPQIEAPFPCVITPPKRYPKNTIIPHLLAENCSFLSLKGAALSEIKSTDYVYECLE